MQKRNGESMKKILITVGMIILLLGMVGGVIIYNKHNGFDLVNVDFNIKNEEIEICNIFEYGDSVYYVLPEENDPYNGKVICKMKKDGTDKELFLNKTPGNMRVYKDGVIVNPVDLTKLILNR